MPVLTIECEPLSPFVVLMSYFKLQGVVFKVWLNPKISP